MDRNRVDSSVTRGCRCGEGSTVSLVRTLCRIYGNDRPSCIVEGVQLESAINVPYRAVLGTCG